MARQDEARDAAEMTRGPIERDPKAKKALSALDVNPGKMDFCAPTKIFALTLAGGAKCVSAKILPGFPP